MGIQLQDFVFIQPFESGREEAFHGMLMLLDEQMCNINYHYADSTTKLVQFIICQTVQPFSSKQVRLSK